MKTLIAIAAACLVASLGYAQTPAPAPRAHNARDMEAVETPHLGVGGQDVTSDRARALKLKEERGAEITSVEPDSAAAKAGLKEGDVVLELNGQKVEGGEQLRRLVHETPIHREVKIGVWRNGGEQTLNATVGGRKEYQVEFDGTMIAPPAWVQPMPSPPMPPQLDLPQFHTMMGTASLGIMGEALGQEAQLAEFFGVKEGVLVRSVNKNSAAEKAGMKAGDVITRIDDTSISTPQQIGGALRAARNKGPVNVTVVRNKKEMSLSVTPETGGGLYHGGLWDPKDNPWLELFQIPSPARISFR
jgi:serine protease Do